MAGIADSSAVNTNRVLPQHHTAITLLGQLLADPSVEEISWLDLACGRGQILTGLNETISDEKLRGKIAYSGYDLENDHSRLTEQIALGLKFRKVDVKTGEMEHFARIFPSETKFSFVSFTNTVHELRPQSIASLLLEIILRLDTKGVLYIYDMEFLQTQELGAVPWHGDDFKKLLSCIFGELQCNNPNLIVQRWTHASCTAWSVNLQRDHLGIADAKIIEKFDAAKEKASELILDILKYKLNKVTEALEALTRFGAGNADEDRVKTKLLFEFWGLQRALKDAQ